MSKATTISITQKTKQRLEQLGRKGETFEEIVLRSLEEPEFTKEAKPLLERAKELEKAPKRNMAEVEDLLRKMTALIEKFVTELRKR